MNDEVEKRELRSRMRDREPRLEIFQEAPNLVMISEEFADQGLPRVVEDDSSIKTYANLKKPAPQVSQSKPPVLMRMSIGLLNYLKNTADLPPLFPVQAAEDLAKQSGKFDGFQSRMSFSRSPENRRRVPARFSRAYSTFRCFRKAANSEAVTPYALAARSSVRGTSTTSPGMQGFTSMGTSCST